MPVHVTEMCRPAPIDILDRLFPQNSTVIATDVDFRVTERMCVIRLVLMGNQMTTP